MRKVVRIGWLIAFVDVIVLCITGIIVSVINPNAEANWLLCWLVSTVTLFLFLGGIHIIIYRKAIYEEIVKFINQ